MKNPSIQTSDWIDEYQNGVRYGLAGKVLLDEASPFQQITIIESLRYGKGLLLDRCWMTAERQEKHYHECLVHPALCSAQQVNRVLIIGGGDGGTARQCLRYKDIKHLDMVEIDKRVIEISQQYLPSIGEGVWTDPRFHLHIKDGISWAANAQSNSYDVIIVDGSDPTGPATGLFNKTFFKNCRRILKPGGIFATQSESPEAFPQIHMDIVRILREVFDFADPLYGCVPMYPSGWWSWSFASMQSPLYLQPLSSRAADISKECEIWSIRWQKGAFQTMPAFIERELKK